MTVEQHLLMAAMDGNECRDAIEYGMTEGRIHLYAVVAAHHGLAAQRCPMMDRDWVRPQSWRPWPCPASCFHCGGAGWIPRAGQ